MHFLITDPRPNDNFHAQHREQLILELSRTSHVTLLPADLRHEGLYFIYKGASFVMYPSLHEGYGLVPLEAATVGCQTIGFDIPGTKHTLVHGSNGWRSRCYDWESFMGLADKIWEEVTPNLRIDSSSIARWASHHQELAKTRLQLVRHLLCSFERVGSDCESTLQRTAAAQLKHHSARASNTPRSWTKE
jgi:glycosyltransferase involved in cell wall biosynthesis